MLFRSQRSKDFWTREEILDGKGPWAQPGEYRRPKEELEAEKAERRWYEEAARRRGWKPEKQPQKCIGGGLRESVAESGDRPEPTPPVNREEQRSKDFWTWEEILDGKGPWAQPGEYRRPKEELEAVKAERRWYEEAARRSGWKPESQPQKCIGGGAYREYGYAR